MIRSASKQAIKSTLTPFVFLLCIFCSTEAAAISIIGAGVTNNTGQTKTDFHVKLTSQKNINVSDAVLRHPPNQPVNGAIIWNGTNEVTVDWDNLSVPSQNNNRITWIVSSDRSSLNVKESYFTPQSPTDVPILGWRIDSAGQVWLTNAFPIAIAYFDLSFPVLSSFDVNAILSSLDSPASGGSSGQVGPAVGSILGELWVGSIPSSSISAGEFFTANFNTAFVNQTYSQLSATELLGTQIPEPPSWVILASALGCLGFLGLRWKVSGVAKPKRGVRRRIWGRIKNLGSE